MPPPRFTLNWYGAGISLRIFVINMVFLALVASGVIALILGIYGNVYESEKRFLNNALQQLEFSMRDLKHDDPTLNLRLQQWAVLFNDPAIQIIMRANQQILAALMPETDPDKMMRTGHSEPLQWPEIMALRLFRINPAEIVPLPPLLSWFTTSNTILLTRNGDVFSLAFRRDVVMQDQIVQLSGAIRIDELQHAVELFRQLIAPVFWLFLVISSVQAIFLGQMISGPLRRLARRLEQIRLDPQLKLITPAAAQASTEIGLLYQFIREMLETIREASQTNKAIIEDFIHEIKNPLASIESAIQSIRKIKDPEKNAMLIKIIEHDLRRMIRILHDVDALFAAGSDGNTYVTNFADVPLVTSLQAIANHLNEQASAEEKQVKIRYVYDREINIRANQFYFEQMMINLLTNAMSFSPPHGEVVLQTITAADGHMVDVIIDDWGAGIPIGKLAKIFERFYTDRENAPRTGEGMYHSGLGLSIAKQTASSMGGQIWAENRLNSNKNIIGARFTVRLPVAEKK